ncbi:MAG: hypothetical protein NTY02_02620 [Acidobacteria bacterium]|nr:hypothetical protein [Acidobacteriota bacterium]
MRKHIPLVLVALVVVASTAALLAAPQATLTLRNGDRVRGELIDLGGVGFSIKSGGVDQNIPANDVALVDFVGGAIPRAEAAKMAEGRAFISMRNGDIVYGRLIDIGGTNPLRLSVRTENGNQDFSSSDVARVFLARWEGM